MSEKPKRKLNFMEIVEHAARKADAIRRCAEQQRAITDALAGRVYDAPPDYEPEGAPSAPAPIPTPRMPTQAELVKTRKGLLCEYKTATGIKSDAAIYGAKGHSAHKPEFQKWRKGLLLSTSAAGMSLERFLREKKRPTPRKPAD